MKKLVLGTAFIFLFAVFCFAGPYGPGAPSKGDPPAKPGEYRIKDKDGGVKYIGETNNLKRRVDEHRRSGKIQPGETVVHKTAKPEASVNDRRAHEQSKIKQHQPYSNKSKGGEGRKSEK